MGAIVARLQNTASHRWYRAALLLVAQILTTHAAFATHVTSAGNTPNSGIAPGHVNMATGELILVMRPDLRLDGPMPVLFRRYYASMLAREGFASSHLGTNWLGTYDWSLAVGPADVTIVTNRGTRIRFVQSPVGGWDLLSPLDQNYRLTQSSGLWRFTEPSSRRIFLFDASTHLLTQIVDAHGNALTLSYVGGRLTQVSDGLGRTLTFGYDPLGFLSAVSDGARSVSYGYTGGNLTSFTDAASGITNYSYASGTPIQGLLSSVAEPLGNAPLNYGYDPSGRVSTLTDAMSHTSIYSYDTPTGNLFSDPLGHTWTFQYDAQDRITSLIDPATGPTSYIYDPQGRLSSMARPMGDPTSFNYDPASGYVSSYTLADASIFSYEYLPHSVGGATLFDLSAAHYPDGTNENYMHDAAGNLTDFMDRGGFPWSWTHNGFGEVLTENNPAGGVTTFTYDPQGRLETRMDNAGNTTHYTFDSFSRLTQIGWPDGPTRSFAYNNLDQLTILTDERGKIWSYAYDDDHRLTGETDPLLHSKQLVWDENDRVSQEVDALGHARLHAYDPDGRMSAITDRTSNTTSFQYDELHRLTGILNAASDTWSGSYDSDSRMTSWQDPLGHAVLIGHDFLDQVTHVTDPVSSPFDFGYDSMGRLLNVTAPLDMGEVMGYDQRGFMTSYRRVTSEVDLGRTPLGQISQVTDPNGNPWPVGHDPQGRPTSDADPLGRTAGYTYDARSRLTHADLPVGSVSFGFDAASRLTDCQWLDGTSLTYAYDDANRMTGATGASFAYDPANRMISSNGLTIGYDFEGRITSETYAPGRVVSYTYDNRGLLSSMSDWVGGTTSFTYDSAERLTEMTRPNGTSVAYAYDADDRLISSIEARPPPQNSPLASITMTRDALGRPTSIDRRQPLMPAVTSPGSMGLAYDPASQVTGPSWDGMARLTSDGTRSFVWDGASRLTRYAAGADSPSFTYDAFGRMLSRSLGASAEQYVWNYARGRPTLDAVYQGLTAKKFYVYTPAGALLYSVDAATGTRVFYHYDEGGNTIFLTNGLGSVTTEYAYTPFGGMSSLGAIADNPFTWGGSYGVVQLGSSGLFRLGVSIYDGMFLRMVSGGALSSGALGYKQGQAGGSFDTGHGFFRHYGIFGHDSDDLPNPWEDGHAVDADCNGGLLTQNDAGTFIHEIGHNIGLDHGGKNPGPQQAPDAFFKSIEGLKVKQEVIEYPEGGIRPGTIHLRPDRPSLGAAEPAEPCLLCPQIPIVYTTPKFSLISRMFFASPANEPTVSHSTTPPLLNPTTGYLEPNWLDAYLYGDRWLSEITRTYWEEEKNHDGSKPVKPPNRPGLGDPLKPAPRTWIYPYSWRFAIPPVGTGSLDPRWRDFVTPMMRPCAPCQ